MAVTQVDLDLVPCVRDYDHVPFSDMISSDLERAGMPLIIAGPCAIESESILERAAEALASLNVKVLRGGAFKPRTLPYSFEGLGTEGLKIHHRVARRYGMMTVSEIFQRDQCDDFSEYIDIIQVGARSMKNPSLLQGVAKTGKPVILKRGMEATIQEWLGAAEHLLHHGCKSLALCERGVRWHDPAFRNLLDLATVAWVKKYTKLPVIVDPSHGTGRHDLISELCSAAIALGADGLMVEVHPSPETARCDGSQSISIPDFRDVVNTLPSL